MELAPAPRMLEELPFVTTEIYLKDYTTLKLGGQASFFAKITSTDELLILTGVLRREPYPWFVLGGGSNILAPDSGYPGVVIHMETKRISWKKISPTEILVTALAGEIWDDLVCFAIRNGWYGIENLSWIPGTVGAAPIQNIGAYGVELSDVLEEVEVYDAARGVSKRLSKQACALGYRTSFFKKQESKNLIVTAVTLRLSTTEKFVTHYKDVSEVVSREILPLSLARMREIIGDIRAQKFPNLNQVGTAGSYFKNPIVSFEDAQMLAKRFPGLPVYDQHNGTSKISLAWILDKMLNLRGLRRGSVGVFEGQPLVFVTYDGATSTELSTFTREIVRAVWKITGIKIFPEVVELSM